MEKLSFKKLRKEQAQSVASEKSDATPKVVNDQIKSDDANAPDNAPSNTNDMDNNTQELLLSKINELIGLLKQHPKSEKSSAQMCEQDKIQLRNFVATGVKDKIDTCLPSLVEKCIPKQEEHSEDIRITKDYFREVSQNYYEIVGLATAMDQRSQLDLESRQEQNLQLRKMRSNQNTALNAAKRFGTQLYADIKTQINRALYGDKPQKPAVPTEDYTQAEAYRYIFWKLPKYYFMCFFTDKHTKAFFRSMIVCTFVVLLSLIGFMAHDLSKCEVQAEKYLLLRDWVNVDSTRAVDKCFYLDGLFEDRINNEQYIKRLRIQIRTEKHRKGSKI